ncbi:hypothetical protein ACGFU4_00320 [Streptomyces sp. NPDC048511]|uniref:hypothetical protein n=1 Tax=Streptomyces sp. NPDC048511 TaxID=3365562 RepID=UPI00371793C0
MLIRTERQLSEVADEVSAITAVIRPILTGLLYSLKHDVVEEAGGYAGLKLSMLARLQRPGDGDCGICFEYAVHDALNREDPAVIERVADALVRCKVPGQEVASILFGAEKTGSQQLIDTAANRLTWESSLLSGTQGRPVKLKRHINAVAAALRKRTARAQLPQSIAGLWKADLFLGSTDADRWVGTTVKINRDALEGAKGLRIGVVPSRQGLSDAIRLDESRNLMVCPMPYDGSFMEVFYQGWEVVRQFIAADALLPKEVNLPRPAQREVARYLADRRGYPVLDVIDALTPLSQPHLLETTESQAGLVIVRGDRDEVGTTSVLAPQPRTV